MRSPSQLLVPLTLALSYLVAAVPIDPELKPTSSRSPTNSAGYPYPTNLHYVSDPGLNDPPVMPHKPKGGIGENVTVYVEGEETTGYGQGHPPNDKKADPKAGFPSVANTGKGSRTLLPNGLWNGTYAKNSTEATYHVLSDFDYMSLQLVLLQEYIELDLFRDALEMFSDEEFEEYGIYEAERQIIRHMSDQEISHAKIVSNIIGPHANKPCKWKWPFKTVGEFINFCQWLTRWGESSVYGFLEHLDSRESAQLILQSITVEARQQMIFRQLQGLHAMPEWHEAAITQSMHWSIFVNYIESCPEENEHLIWAAFPRLNITNGNRGIQGKDSEWKARVNTINHVLSTPGEVIELEWEDPGKPTGPNNSYVTSTLAGEPKFAAWISHLNVTYTPLENIEGNKATTVQPWGRLFEGDETYPVLVNGTVFVAITDADVYITPYNMSRLDAHIRAGPWLYVS